MSGIIDQQFLSACGQHFINHAWTGRDDVHVVLAPEPFLDDLHVKQTKEPAAKSETQRNRAFRLINKGGIIQTQLADRGLQMFEVTRVNRINPAEDHWMNFLETEQRFACGMPLVGDRVADLYVGS